MGSWPSSQWKQCWRQCVEGKLWTNYAVSTYLTAFHGTCYTSWDSLSLPVVSQIKHTGALLEHTSRIHWQYMFLTDEYMKCGSCIIWISKMAVLRDVFAESKIGLLSSLRYFLTDLWLEWSHGVCQVWPVSPRGAETAHGCVRGPLLRLHGAFGADVLPSAGGIFEHAILRQVFSILCVKFVSTHTSLCVCIQKKIMLNTFLDVLMADPPPQCLVWLPLMHRLANVENGKTWTRCTSVTHITLHCTSMLDSHHSNTQVPRFVFLKLDLTLSNDLEGTCMPLKTVFYN